VTNQASILFFVVYVFLATKCQQHMQEAACPIQLQFFLFAWTFLQAYSSMKFKSSGYKYSPYFKNILKRKCIVLMFYYLEFAVGLI
jgi:hypothetical protein